MHYVHRLEKLVEIFRVENHSVKRRDVKAGVLTKTFWEQTEKRDRYFQVSNKRQTERDRFCVQLRNKVQDDYFIVVLVKKKIVVTFTLRLSSRILTKIVSKEAALRRPVKERVALKTQILLSVFVTKDP